MSARFLFYYCCTLFSVWTAAYFWHSFSPWEKAVMIFFVTVNVFIDLTSMGMAQ